MADKREVVLDLLARDKSGPAVKSFGKGLEDVGDKADKAGKKAKDFGEKSELAAKGADNLGDQADGTARQLGKLDREIAKTTAELVILARQFADTDDKAQRLDISKSIRKAQNDLRRLNTGKSILLPELPDSEVKTWSGGVKKKIDSALKDLGPLKAGAGALGAGLAPLLGGVIAAGIVGAVGTGGIIGGLALVAKSPEIKGQAKDIGTAFSAAVNSSAQSAFLQPAREALYQVDQLAARSAPKIGKIFAATAPSVDMLTQSVTHFADALLDGAVDAAEKSGPVMKVLGDTISDTGDSLGHFLSVAASHSDEAATSLSEVNDVLQLVIGGVTVAVDALGTIKGGLDSLDEWAAKAGFLGDVYEALTDQLKGPLGPLLRYAEDTKAAGEASGTFAHHIQGLSESQVALIDSTRAVTSAAEAERHALVDVSNAMRAQTDPVFGLLDASDQLADAQDKVTKATKDHGAKSREAKAALRELASAAINLEGKAGALGATFNGKLTPQLRATLKAAGVTDSQIAALGRQFTSAKNKGNAFAKKYTAAVAVRGTPAVVAALFSVKDAADSIPRSVTIAMRITGNKNVSESANAIRKNIAARATGGPVSKSVPYWVGEEGPELIIPENHGRVLSASASRSLMGRGPAARGMGGPTAWGTAAPSTGFGTPQKVRLEVAGEGEVVAFLRRLIRTANLLQDA